MRTIRLMADYQCFPLWEASPGQVGNIDPKSLPISDELRIKLMNWARDYDETLNMDDPVSSGFRSDKEEAEFIEAGLELADRLRSELGSDFVVEHS